MSESVHLTAVEQFWAWADRGACRGRESLFYHGEDEPKGKRRRKEAEAKSICEGCEVLETCRDYALNNGELYGVWGGLTENERHRLTGRQRSG